MSTLYDFIQEAIIEKNVKDQAFQFFNQLQKM